MLQIRKFVKRQWKRMGLFAALLLLFANICQGINYRPSFTRSSLVKTIPENEGAGYVIADISDYTVDDEGDIITYSLDSYGSQICNINSRTGRLTLKKSLDREVQASFKIIVSAQDSHQGGGHHRTAMLPVFLYVLDVNDNAPIFDGTPYIATIPENTTVGSRIITVSAHDNDDGQNKDLTYAFKSGKGADKFSISPDTGIVRLAKKLDYEVEKKYVLVVIAKDKGTPQSLKSYTTLVIDVTDICDTKPYFLKSSYQVQIDENQPMGASILTVKALDGDKAVNHSVRYAIDEGNQEGLFTLDRISGVIRVNGTLDKERNNIFKLKLKACEVPDSTSYAHVIVIIILSDVNDNKPVFPKKSYYFTVKEDEKVDYVLAEQFNAHDADIEEMNSKFEYSLEGDWSVRNTFTVDSKTGKLQLYGPLDYEKRRNYTFLIRATETESSQKFNTTASITVHVLNVNDNRPVFQKLMYLFKVFENITTDKVIGRVKAVDADAGSLGQVQYQIEKNEIGSASFTIDPKSGELRASKPLSFLIDPMHTFFVIATDGTASELSKASESSKAFVVIKLIKVRKPTTPNPTTTPSPTPTAKTTIKTLEIDNLLEKYDAEKTVAASARTASSSFSVILLSTLLYLLRVLVT